MKFIKPLNVDVSSINLNSWNKASNMEHLIDAAMTLFLDKGISEVSLGMVADACSLTRRTVINHFGTKENLIKIATDKLFESVKVDMVKRLESDNYKNMTGLEQIRFYIDCWRKCLFDNPRLFLLFKELETHLAVVVNDVPAQRNYFLRFNYLDDYVKNALERGLDDGTVRGDLDLERARNLLTNTYMALLQRFSAMLIRRDGIMCASAEREFAVFYETTIYYLTQYPLVIRHSRSMKLLIADDIEMNREMLKNLFNEEYNVLTAENGRDALRVLKENPDTALVILDLRMPVMDGFEFLEIVRADKAFDDTAIIVNTIYGESENEVRALRLGADEFIFKPFNPEVIRFRVRNVMLKFDKLIENREMHERLLGRGGIQV